MAGIAAWPIRAASGASDWDSAVRRRDRIREVIAGLLSAEAIDAAVVVSEDGNYPPWVLLEAWLPDEGARSMESRRRVLLEFTINVAPYHQSPILLTSRLLKGWERLELSARSDFGDEDVRAWILYALDRGPKPANYRPFRDALILFLLSFVPFLESPLINRLDYRYRPTKFTPEAILTTVALILFFAGAAALSGDSGGGGGLLIFVALAAFAGVFAVAHRPQVVVAPSQPRAPPPRRLAIIDSWHAVASGCGEMAGAFEGRFVAMFKAASSDPTLGVSAVPERITYRTSNGYEKRQRLVVSRNQATVLIDIQAAGDDLYVGWQGYLNWAQWIESAPVSVRIEDGTSHHFRALAPGLYRPNEFDLVDLNCIADLAHRVLRSELEKLLKEREIDEEIDFEIVRGDRQRAFDADRYAGELADPDARDNTWTGLMRSMGSWRTAGSGGPIAAPIESIGAAASYESTARIQRFLNRYPTTVPFIVLAIGVLLGIAVNPSRFATANNISTVLAQVTVTGILGVGQTLVILTAGIDLSIGVIAVISSVVMGHLAVLDGDPTIIAFPLGLLAGATCGFINGSLVTRNRSHPPDRGRRC